MSSEPPGNDADSARTPIGRFEEICDAFEAAWQAGRRPRMEDALDAATGMDRKLVLQELLLLELAYRRRQGDPVTEQEYLGRFPEDSVTIGSVFCRQTMTDIPGSAAPSSSSSAWTAVACPSHEAIGPDEALRQTRPSARGSGASPDDATIERSSLADPYGLVGPPALAGLSQFEILGELGRGGMGVVYKARHRRINRVVALKMIHDVGHGDPERRARFQVEAKAVGQLDHPNIVQIFDAGDAAGRPFVTLELLEGGSLADRLKEAIPAVRVTAELVATLASAMHVAHRAGIVHRDLKPSNVLFDARGVPKIADFGLAKQLDLDEGHTTSGQVMGTPSYMAPEQAEGSVHRLGPPADIYALGAILYEMLTGRPPFKGAHLMETLRQVIWDEVVPPSRLQPRTPRDLETICLKCLQREPAKRYATAEDLAEDLRRYLDCRPIHARRTAPWEHGAKWLQRHPVTATLLGLGLAAVVGLAAAVLGHDARRKAEVRREDRRVAGRRAEVDRALFAAQGFLAEKKWNEGKLILTNLLTDLKAERRLADLRDRASAQLARVERGLESEQARQREQQRLARFLQRRGEVFFKGIRFTGLDLATSPQATREAAEAALGVFAAAGAADPWTLATLPDALEPAERAAIVEGCYEVLLVLADAVAQPMPGEDAEEQARRGLRVLDRAARLRPEPTPAYHRQRAACLVRLGDDAAAAHERDAAETLKAATALDLFLAGQERYRRGDWKPALRDFNDALDLQPDHFWAHCLAAICAVQTQQYAMAKRSLSYCLKREPAFAWLYLLRGFASGQAAARTFAAARALAPLARSDGSLRAEALAQFEAAEDDCRKALTLLEQKPVDGLKYLLLHNRALMRSQLDRLDDAVADYREAIGLDATRYEAFAGLAQVLHRQKQWDEAVEQLTRAILLKPGYAPLYRERARVQRTRDEPTREQRLTALHDLDRAVASEAPGSPILASDQTERGKLLQGLHRPEEALAACDAALKVLPDHAEAHRLRVIVLLELKRYDDVLRSCDGALAGGKPAPEILAIRGQARAARGDYAGAVADYSQALALRPGDPAMLSARGLAYMVSNAPELALHDFDEVLRRDPSDAEAQGGRGQVLVRLGDYRAAVVAAEESLRHGPPEARRAYNAARVYAEAARLAAADTTARGAVKVALVDQYQQRAVALVQRALERTPPDRRAAFWQTQVRTDPALRLLQRRLKLSLPSQAAPDSVTSGGEPSSRVIP